MTDHTAIAASFAFCLKKMSGTEAVSSAEMPITVALAEKLIAYELFGPSIDSEPQLTSCLADLSDTLAQSNTDDLRVVVLGGGSGLSNVIGGDSRNAFWCQAPFEGLKRIFPRTRSIVCVTDDGGSTGELLKDLPLIALGDLRHVLLSSCQLANMQQSLDLSEADALRVANVLCSLFNYRFDSPPASARVLLNAAGGIDSLPEPMRDGLWQLVVNLFNRPRLAILLQRPHCLGNLLLVAAIFSCLEDAATGGEDDDIDPEKLRSVIVEGINLLASLIGVEPMAVLPCLLTPAMLQVLYANGVLVTGENKVGRAHRGAPVDRIFVEFGCEPLVPSEALASIKEADVIILAPGSLYTSIIPILQVPDIVETIRCNTKALKVLVANLWVQKGETDVVMGEPKRRFHVSDLLNAYQRNIPGGLAGLFDKVLALGMHDIPGSILQSYAVENKDPIYLDANEVRKMGFEAVEAGIFSRRALKERMVLQHDPDALARAVRILWAVDFYCKTDAVKARAPRLQHDAAARSEDGPGLTPALLLREYAYPCQRFRKIEARLAELTVAVANGAETIASAGQEKEIGRNIRQTLAGILWKHADIPVAHLGYFKGLCLIAPESWHRCQQWDNVFSFYDPDEQLIKVRQDVFSQPERFEVAFLVALGQSLMGNYAAEKTMQEIKQDEEVLGKAFRLVLRPPADRCTFFSSNELDCYLRLTRMVPSLKNPLLYTRLINGHEGFTPPGLLFGLVYAWYLDNRFAAHIEYKMAVMHTEISTLIPEQVKIFLRRKSLVDFFRQQVFRYNAPAYSCSSLKNKIYQ